MGTSLWILGTVLPTGNVRQRKDGEKRGGETTQKEECMCVLADFFGQIVFLHKLCFKLVKCKMVHN